MNIGETAEASGLPPKTIRYYEQIGLIQPARRANGYRDFSANDVSTLTFVARARSLGFSIEECRALLSLYEDDGRRSASVKKIAAENLERVSQKIAALEEMKQLLAKLIDRCRGDEGADCPILERLAGAR